MAKKNSIKDTEQTLSLFGKIRAIFKNETIHFVIGLILVIFSVYLLLAFSSFFFTGAADQSIIDSGSAQELASTNNGVKNYAGSRGAQLASYLINDCFGISSFFILVFLAVAGLKLMRVRVVRLWKWFIGWARYCSSGFLSSLDSLLWSNTKILSYIWAVCMDTMSAIGWCRKWACRVFG